MAVGDLFRFRFAKHSTTSFGGAATNREKLNEANNNYIARDTDFIQGVSTGFVADITSACCFPVRLRLPEPTGCSEPRGPGRGGCNAGFSRREW